MPRSRDGRMTTPWFSTIFSTGVENFARKTHESTMNPAPPGTANPAWAGSLQLTHSGRVRYHLRFGLSVESTAGADDFFEDLRRNEADVSAQQPPAPQDARIPGPDGHQERPHGPQASPREGPQTPDGGVQLGPDGTAGEGVASPPSPAPDRRFRRHQHIRQRADVQQVYDTGRKYQGRYMIAFSLPRAGQPARLGIAATRKLGMAVERNRAKRRVRELFRHHPAPPGFDIVVVPRRALIEAAFAHVEAEYVATLGRLRPARAAH